MAYLLQCLMAWLLMRWIDGATTAAREGCGSYHVRVTNVGRKVRSGYLQFRTRMRGLYRSRQNDRLRMMLVLVHIDITPPPTPLPVFQRIGE
ncbi:hypothetical protein TNCV_3570581 [Trichonephila clavipes]|nr:hypothetical protein TNCV_3570581 [Trichonephila clavipes]